MNNYNLYFFIVLGLLLAIRFISNRQFYKLNDADKLKTFELSRKTSRISYIFYGVAVGIYLLAVYVFDVDFSLATQILATGIALYVFIFSIRIYKKVKSENIVIPYYGFILSARVVTYAFFCVLLLLYARQSGTGHHSMAAYEAMEEARARWEKGDNRSAIEIYNKLIAEDSTVSIYYVNRGVYRYNAGYSDGAYSDWNKSLSMGDTTALRYIKHTDQ